ncbi:MAG TPA: EF-hand domain-containing protein [Allosphingosinicella sp.]
MRSLLPFLLLLVPAAAAAQPPAAPAVRGSLFMSPMGEPFRSDDRGADNIRTWFGGADRDSDGALSLAELRHDAVRFFAALDRDGDGEIGPVEITRYENEVAPEVQLGLQMRSTGFGDWRGPGSRRRRIAVFDKGLEGAGRYAFLNIPQPVIAADLDMNRGVSRDEFARAAGQRFALLDTDQDGRLVRAELPPLPQPRTRRPRDDEPVSRPIGNRRY